MITINKIEKEFGNKTLFKDLSLNIQDGEHIGIVGKNGSGKSTLLKIIAGELGADSGVVSKGGTITFVHQIQQQEQYSSENIAEFNKIKSELNIKDVNANNFNTLSGGEKTKLAISAALAKNPNILLLDEPTNNLDEESIEWLLGVLSTFCGTVITVSHDRYFLDAIVERIIEIDNGKVVVYDGNYTQYEIQKQQRLNYEKKQYAKKVEENEKISAEISALKQRTAKLEKESRRDGSSDKRSKGFKGGVQNKINKIARQVQAKKTRLEKLQNNLKNWPEEEKEIFYRVNAEQTHTKLLAKFEGASKSFGKRELFQNASFEIGNGEKIALSGKNGSGKTTLIKMLMGEDKDYVGSVWKSKNFKAAYLPQNAFEINSEQTIIEYANSFLKYKTQFLTNLCNMGMKREIFDKKICNLSAGEKMKIKLNELILGDFNFLILDEPTNNLDIENKIFLEKVLSGYKGTLLLVCHDNALIKNVCNKMLKIEAQKITKTQI